MRHELETQVYEDTPLNNFMSFFHTIRDLLFILDMEGNILQVNQSVIDRLGYTEEELLGKSVLIVHPEHRRNEANQNVIEMLQMQREYCPIPLISKSGLEIPVETRVTLGKWDNKEVLFGVSKDISELKLSEEKFQKVFHNNASLIAISSTKDGKYIDVNQTFCDVLGYQRDEVLGKTSKDLALFKSYEDRDKVLTALETEGRVHNVEVEVLDRDNVTHIGRFYVERIYVGSEPCLVTAMVDVTELKRLEREIKQQLNDEVFLTESLVNQPSVGIFFMTMDTPIDWNASLDKDRSIEYVFVHQKITKVNQKFLDQFGAKAEHLIGSTLNTLFPNHSQELKRAISMLFDEGYYHSEFKMKRFDGGNLFIDGDYICNYDLEGRIIGYFGIHLDVTNQKLAEEAAQKYRDELVESEERYRLLAESASDVIWVYNLSKSKFTYFSPSIEYWMGYSVEEALTLSLDQFLTPEFYTRIEEVVRTSYPQILVDPKQRIDRTLEAQLIRKDGSVIWAENSSVFRSTKNHDVELIGISRNIDERRRKEEQIQHLMTHDPLTGLMNRNALVLSGELMDHSQDSGEIRSFIIIDIDKFGMVNDTMGHLAGDDLLKLIAGKIIEDVGQTGTVYRSGGDEFLVILKTNTVEVVDQIAKKILVSISRPIYINQRTLFLSASLGVSLGSTGVSFKQLLQNADTALFVAKKTGNTLVNYVPEMDHARTRELILAEDLQYALQNNELELWLQPIYDVCTSKINHAEALLRWTHPELGRISPAEFIPIAEKTKLIVPITEWVIQEACFKIAAFKGMGIDDFSVSVNISSISLENHGVELINQIHHSIQESGIAPSHLNLEITESALIGDTGEIVKILHQMKQIGVKLALDDFGTGYSSFGYMKDLPLDIIKLDRSLISQIATNEKEQMIVSAMVAIIHGLGIKVVIEGVETNEQFVKLKQYNCDYIQGFLFSRPLPTAEFVCYYRSMKDL